MSTTELYGIKKNGDVTYYGSAQNSWLGGMHVWNTLNEKYHFGDSLFTEFKTTWANFNKGIYEKYEDVLLGSTFDGFIVLEEQFDYLISNFEQYYQNYPGSNFNEQIEIIKQMQNDENIIGVAWCQTSIVDDYWDYDYDEEDEVIPYNIFKGKTHENLFEQLIF